jgi:hypothetical protein
MDPEALSVRGHLARFTGEAGDQPGLDEQSR